MPKNPLKNKKMLEHIRTPLVKYKGAFTGWKEIWLKDESCQHSNAFKFRGVARKINSMNEGATVVTASTGNHGIAMALAASRKGMQAMIFVPKHTAEVKKNKLVSFGAQLTEVDGGYQDCVQRAKTFADETGAIFLHGFDNTEIIQGNRSLFHEVKEELREEHCCFIPVGGGGLLTACLDEYDAANICAVELDHAPSLSNSLTAGERVRLGKLTGRADGLMVDQVGEAVFNACAGKNVNVQLVTEKELEQAVRLLWKHNGIKAELSGAAALAAALRINDDNRSCLCVVSGGNIDPVYFEEIISAGSPMTADGELRSL